MFRFRKRSYSPNKRPIEEYRRGLRGCVEKIIRRHRQIMIESGTDPSNADAMLSDAALEKICNKAMDVTDPIEYAALALDSINSFHPFVDGNKRTSLAVALKILESSGYTLDEGPELERFVLDIARGEYDVKQIEVWLRYHVKLIRRVF